ncbi:MAG: hypothetical protein D6788_08675, partial [Planctomycetota bacterium]
EEERTALRQIARETGSSFARVAQCERQLQRVIREALEGDPEFAALRESARRRREGIDAPIDRALERELARLSGEAFVRALRSSDHRQRVELLDLLLSVSGTGLERAIRAGVATLPGHLRERLFQEAGRRGVLRSIGSAHRSQTKRRETPG